MTSRKVAGGLVALVLVCVLVGSIVTYSWGMGSGPVQIPFGLTNGTLETNSINYQMFEVWGPVLLVLGTLMFGAIIAGVCISKEEEKKEGEE